MPPRRGLRYRPRDYLESGYWPIGSLRELTEEEERENTAEDVLDVARFVKKLAMKIEEERAREPIYKVANNANVNPQTLDNFIRGKTWGDVVVLFRLERGLNAALWDHDHLSPSPRPRDYLTEGHRWPHGRLKPGTPPHVHFTKQLAVELQKVCAQEGPARVADYAGYHQGTIIEFLDGETFADVEFVFRVEHAFKTKLWSHNHLSQRWANRYDSGT